MAAIEGDEFDMVCSCSALEMVLEEDTQRLRQQRVVGAMGHEHPHALVLGHERLPDVLTYQYTLHTPTHAQRE